MSFRIHGMKSLLARSFDTAARNAHAHTWPNIKAPTRSCCVLLFLLLSPAFKREWSGYCYCRLAIAFIRFGALVFGTYFVTGSQNTKKNLKNWTNAHTLTGMQSTQHQQHDLNVQHSHMQRYMPKWDGYRIEPKQCIYQMASITAIKISPFLQFYVF